MVASLAYRKSFDRRPRYPLAFLRTRLRRARLAGALVALGILFRPAVAGLLVQRAVVTLSIFPTSPADLVPLCGTRWRDASDVCRDGKNRWLAKNDNGFSYREIFSV